MGYRLIYRDSCALRRTSCHTIATPMSVIDGFFTKTRRQVAGSGETPQIPSNVKDLYAKS